MEEATTDPIAPKVKDTVTDEFARRRLEKMLEGMSNEKVEGVMDFIGFWTSMRNLGDKYVRDLSLEMVILESYRRNMTNGNETHD